MMESRPKGIVLEYNNHKYVKGFPKDLAELQRLALELIKSKTNSISIKIFYFDKIDWISIKCQDDFEVFKNNVDVTQYPDLLIFKD